MLFAPAGLYTTFNLQTYHQMSGGTVSGNILAHCRTGCGYLNLGSSGTDRAGYIVFTGNNMIANHYSFKGGTVGTGGVITLDNSYLLNGSIFDAQIKDSGSVLIGTGPLNYILNV